MEHWRVFIAIELPHNIRVRLAKHIHRLRDLVPDARASWAREDNLHVTLKFLGDTSVARIETLSQVAQRAANAVAPFEIVVEGCGSFPERGQPRVLWIGVLSEPPADRGPRAGNPRGVGDAGGPDLPASPLPLCSLHAALEDECATAGFAREPRDFHPHLTIARTRRPQGSRQLAAMHQEIGFNRETISVSELVVIRSELRSEGSRHTVISRHSLSS
jgi:2'-5' RNA ligase